jgi:hypothetical protein
VDCTYDTRGNLDSMTYPSGEKFFMPRREGNGIDSITRQFGTGPVTNVIESYHYNPANLPSYISYGNALLMNISSDARNRPDVMNTI